MKHLIGFCLLFLLATSAAAQSVDSGIGGEIRVLDKVTGETSDLEMQTGVLTELGHLKIVMDDCRFPISNPSGDAFALLTVFYRDETQPVFSGWMIASAPALNAMDHPRYDIWALRCITS